MAVLKNKKVIAALVGLVLTVIGVAIGVDLSEISGHVTEAACSVVNCV